ncbi:MAG: transaldolase [Caldilineaceae bacterium]|nr:transaldolase [Caldilineaceae bacterium]
MANQLQELRGEGQSVWLDFIERSMIQSGELADLVEEGIGGVTSNPAIFKEAISNSQAYDDDIRRLAVGDKDVKAIFEELAVADIQAAADVLRPVYDANRGQDGFVSLEVAPDLAYDTEATIAEARRLHKWVNRPNLMVKVPATEAGLEAIRRLTADGININVTLIFSLDRYAAVKEAYISGLEARRDAGLPIDGLASVASFFVSRVDANIDKRLEQLKAENPGRSNEYAQLQGKIAVANAKLAYAQFKEVFAGPRWDALAAAGAHAQRPLWASTSTKNPAYPDLLYVETLIGPYTVNTMPPNTLDALLDHGKVKRTVDAGVGEASEDMVKLATVGISIDQVTDELEAEGVQKFADAFQELMEVIETQRKAMPASS